MPRLKRITAKVSMIGSTLSVMVSPRLRGRRAVERNQRWLREHPYCESCTALATEVDHKVPLHLGGTDAEPNLQGLCHVCHARKTAAEQAARA